jgi:exopolysaccharide production protein ExoQ
MPPFLALLVSVVFCVWAIRRYTPDEGHGGALWLPVIWVFFIGSRFLGQWLALFNLPHFGGASLEEGSPIDAAFLLCLMLWGLRLLGGRNVSISAVARDNVWLSIFLVYCVVAISWSDFPFVAFKRWVKTLGHPIMALVILTNPTPLRAFQIVLLRSAIIMLTASTLLIKYFPEYGRTFNMWTGEAQNSGINLTKNELGQTCVAFGLFLIWHFIRVFGRDRSRARNEELLLTCGLLSLAVWLLVMARSSTSLVVFCLGAIVLVGLEVGWISRRYFTVTVVGTFGCAMAIEYTFGLYAPFVEMLGKDPTLTDRTLVWRDIFSLVTSPAVGAGFESFWLGERLDFLWSKWWWKPNQAHNGYIETYINLGWLGLSLQVALLLAVFHRISRSLAHNAESSALQMALFLSIVAYNVTEATFKGLAFLYTLFFLIALRIPTAVRTVSARPSAIHHNAAVA